MIDPIACPRPFNSGVLPMPDFSWQAVLLAIVVSFGLGGCNSNYKFNDSDYRPLGDPQAVNRGK